MASFAQTQQVPFSQLAAFPVELYGRVGMMKQSMYDANTAKVQAFHDSIAGLDIIKEPQKAYLDSQLTKLRTDLSSLAEADFSKQSVVNQAAALAGPLSKDPTIQGAVLSTAAFRKGMSDVEKAKKDGTWSPDNTWDFQDQANKWLTDGQVDSSFNHQYTPYRDVHKKVAEAFKLLNPDITEKDIAFNPNGTLNDAMLREKIKGVPPEKVRSILTAALDAGDYKQLDISSRYKYQNYSPQALKTSIKEHYSPVLQDLYEKRQLIADAASTSGGSLNGQLKTKKQQLDNQIASIEGRLSSWNTEIDDGNIEEVKSAFGTNSVLDRYSSTLSFTEFSNQLLKNPIREARLDELKFQFDQQMRSEDLRLKKKQDAREEAKVTKESYGDYVAGIDRVEVTEETLLSALDAQKKALDISQAEMEARHNPSGSPSWYATQKHLYQIGAYENLSPDMLEHFNTREVQEGDYKDLKQSYDKIAAEVEQTMAPTLQEGATTYDRLKNTAVALGNNPGDLAASIGGLMGLGGESRGAIGRSVETLAQNPLSAVAAYQVYREGKEYQRERAKLVNERIKATTGLGAVHEIPLGTSEQSNKDIRNRVGAIVSEYERTGTEIGTSGFSNSASDIEGIKKALAAGNATFGLVVAPAPDLVNNQYSIRISSSTDKGGNVTQLIPISADVKQRMFGNIDQDKSGGFNEKTQARIIRSKNGTTNQFGIADINEALKNPYLKNIHFPGVKNFSVRGDIYTGQGSGSYNAKLYVYNPLDIPNHPKGWTPVDVSRTMLNQNALNQLIAELTDKDIYQLLYGTVPNTAEIENIKKVSTIK